MVSVIPKSGVNADAASGAQLVLSTCVNFVFERYRVLFTLDVSPSLSSISASGTVLFDELYSAFEKSVRALLKPLSVPAAGGEEMDVTPEIVLCVTAQGAGQRPLVMLLHGCVVTFENLNEVLELVRKRMRKLEETLAKENPVSGVSTFDLSTVLQSAVFVLSRLPRQACPCLFRILSPSLRS